MQSTLLEAKCTGADPSSQSIILPGARSGFADLGHRSITHLKPGSVSDLDRESLVELTLEGHLPRAPSARAPGQPRGASRKWAFVIEVRAYVM
eukprot:15484205-Alexandrium_andersonii.AAC.1